LQAGTIYGVTVFKPTDDEDYIAAAGARYLMLFDLHSQTVMFYPYPDTTIDAGDSVDLIQAGIDSGTLPQLYILRGDNKPVLKYDANTNAITLATGFAPGDFALYYQDRIAVANGQKVYVSDFLDFTMFNLLNQFQICKGGVEYLRTLLTYQNDYVLIGTSNRWMIAYFDPNVGTGGYSGGLSDSSFLRQITAEAGPLGPQASIEANGQIWFITSHAIYAFQPKLDNSLTVLGKPLSAPIQPIMDRMSVNYSGGVTVKHYGYRLYFALPICDEPVAIAAVTLQAKTVVGLTLPFNLPTTLSTDYVAQITTAEKHNLAVNDTVQLSGSPVAAFNGEFTVLSVVDDFTYQVRIAGGEELADPGNQMTSQKIATRNNCVAVYNLKNDAWESIDWLPPGIFADWMLLVETGSQLRLVVVDQDSGPMLYEEQEADDLPGNLGGINLPFNLPVNLSAVNYSTAPIRGHFLTRAMRWGAYNRKVRGCEARAVMDGNSNLTLNLMVRAPNNAVFTSSRTFSADQFDTTDVALRKLCGMRGLEAQLEVVVNNGRPTVRSVTVETVNVGKLEE
jgi:hypothetical protein